MSASRERYDELGLYDVAFDDVIQLEARYATQYGQLGRLTVRRAFEARTGNGTRPPKSPSAPVAWDGRNAVSLSELFEHPDLCSPPDFDWRPYTARGRIALLSVAPKAGKSTLAAYYAAHKADGLHVAGRAANAGQGAVGRTG